MQQDQSSAPLRRVQPARRKWPWPLDLYQSAVGKKWAMAVTGVMLLGFVLIHMIGNLKAYLGPEDLNHYGEWLREIAVPALPRTVFLWLLRGGLIVAFAVHMHAAWSLTRMNHRARPAKYASNRDYVAANFASRTMRWTGIIVILFVIFHLADLTWGSANPEFVRGEPYHNMVESFSRVPVAAAYVVANLALAVHIFHGAWSLFASLGVSNPRLVRFRRSFAAGFAALILIGNISFPVMVQANVIQ
ncbi:MAG TPA: succinate dehydrogenase cytochrome b subunit [Acidimicrobiia bacterium]|nr:succinate dehydrogenase cytochrome b subunit [Acidimicrobiia bacterium]